MKDFKEKNVAELLISSNEFFVETVNEAIEKRKVKTLPQAKLYLANLMNYFMVSENLYGESNSETLAEQFLTAINAERSIQVELLKKLGDTSLYISGFFGDSLKRKIVDLDYYIDMGGNAYGSLAGVETVSERALLWEEFSNKFVEFVDVLTYISQKSLVQTNKDLLRLYDRYLSTGSRLAKEELIEKGLLHPQLKKAGQQ
ncbi:MAG: hypothetical protein KDD50_09945 [Bdellovibrionales bacterium]|nr:hypothetical protein [Bdellovibrionales bacterium]MCB0414643.1 hypothetical protein [Bdellovibrionales bacterium]